MNFYTPKDILDPGVTPVSLLTAEKLLMEHMAFRFVLLLYAAFKNEFNKFK